MKQKLGKPHAMALHAPIPELKAALAMPAEKRRGCRNSRRRETMAEALATGWPGKPVG